ncbi:MAG: XamI family restriction endonuclease [FCB group bacterium]|jgi:hypothetical protein|nr:XamI family restriction endonuclease [FCB group bacterium]
MIPRPVWTREQLDVRRQRAIAIFREKRILEPLELYLEAFDMYQGTVEELLEATIDLSELSEETVEVLADPRLLEALRYAVGPPISADDLKTLADAGLAPNVMRHDSEMRSRIIDVIINGLDRRRFPWVSERREPSEVEKRAAVVASAALLATRRSSTARRHEDKNAQENEVQDYLVAQGFQLVAPRTINVLSEAPEPGSFCRESMFGTRKADIVLGLWDRRVMPIECKVSNSALNSIKRLNNDAAVKAESWRREFGELQVVSSAVLSGVYGLAHLEIAQQRGLTLFWAHALDELGVWAASTKTRKN